MVIPMANYYFNTKDLLFIAILSCLGGVASTYVGYLAGTFGRLTGIPFGGQLLSGLHIFWIILIMAIVDKKGAGALAGLMKGFVEFVSGSHLGAGVLLVSLTEGIFAEVGFWLPKKLNRTVGFIIAGALGSWANIPIQQLLYNRFGGNYYLLGTVSVFSLLSGAIFAGYMGVGIYRLLVDSGVIKKPTEPKRSIFSVPGVVAIVLIAFLAVLAGAYCVSLTQPSGGSTVAPPANGTDMHAKLYVEYNSTNKTYDLAEHVSRFITVNASKKTKSGVEPAKNYTGLPLRAIVEMAGGNPGHIDVIASDGYQQTFSASEVNDDVILVPNGKGLCDVVAKGKPGSMWVKDVVKIKLY